MRVICETLQNIGGCFVTFFPIPSFGSPVPWGLFCFFELLTVDRRLTCRIPQQAHQSHNNFAFNQVVVDPATFAVQFAISSDPEFKLITKDNKYLTVVQTAQIFTKYYGDKTDLGQTVAENFS